MQHYIFFASSDIVVIGSNPEMADIDNPRGDLFGEAWYVYAENQHGDRCRFYMGVDKKTQSENMACALTTRLTAGKLPVAFDRWEHTRPSYGSDAYTEYGQADDVALEIKEQYGEYQ